jgi:hypothetical protein
MTKKDYLASLIIKKLNSAENENDIKLACYETITIIDGEFQMSIKNEIEQLKKQVDVQNANTRKN